MRREKRKWCAWTAVCAALAVLVFCAQEYNPFSDVSNVRAVVRLLTFEDGDTVEIFGDDTLDVSIAVAELVDSFSIHCTANRIFTDTTIVLWGGTVSAAYRFFISLYDTGRQELSIVTWRKGSGSVTERFMVYAKSPLHQEPIVALYDTPLPLATPPVAARDVMYHWDFGRGSLFHSASCRDTVVVTDAGFNDSGYLWVSDVKNLRQSPRCFFSFSLSDNAGPLIICVNDGYVGRDTIITGSVTFPLRLSITDRGRGVYQASIDGGRFSIVQDPIYVKVFNRMDTLTGLLPVTVSAIDNAVWRNESVRTFYIGYNAGMPPAGEGVRITMLVPPADSMVFNTRDRYLLGIVENFTGDSVDLRLRFAVNDSTYSPDIAVKGGAVRFEWEYGVYLDSAINVLHITALDADDGTVAADTTLTLLYDAAIREDTVAPVIIELTSAGARLDRLYTPADSIHVRAVVFDEGAGLSSVRINGAAMLPAQEGRGYVWGLNVRLQHNLNGNNLTVIARDKANLADTMRVVVFKNSAPQIRRRPSPPVPLFAGGRYSDAISILDDDNDPITITKKEGPAGLAVDRLGNITWSPTAADIGSHRVVIGYSDQFEPQIYSYTLYVEDTADFSLPAFSTTEQHFPRFVEVAAAPLDISLTVAAGHGTPPLTYTAAAPAGVTQPLVKGNRLMWSPAVADTGFQRLVVAVIDAYGKSDTLAPVILVVPPNRPCTLSAAFGVEVRPDGALNLNRIAPAETLHFAITDPDHPLSESHNVSITSSVAAVTSAVDTLGKFTVVLDPSARPSGRDTLRVRVTDRAGHACSVAVKLYYGTPPDAPVSLSPADGAADVGTAVTLSWKRGSDADGDALRYIVFFDTLPQSATPIDTLQDTTITVTGLRSERHYYWKVRACDAKSSTDGTVRKFITRLFKRITVNTTGAGMTEQVTGFPLLVRLTNEHADVFAAADASGRDIRFAGADGRPLAYEIERWNTAQNKAEIWVRMDTVRANSASQYIVMYYAASPAIDSSNPAAVFDTANGFVGVWHMGAAGTGTRFDATAYHNDGVTVNFEGNEQVEGLIAMADSGDTNAPKEYIDCGNAPSVHLRGPLTLEVWMKGWMDGEKLISKHDWGNGNRSFSLYCHNSLYPRKMVFEVSENGTAQRFMASSTEAGATGWNYVAVTYDLTTITMCVNGQFESSSSIISGLLYDTDVPLMLMGNMHNNQPFNVMSRPVDEARVSRVARSRSWLKLCYESQRQGSTVVTVQDY